MYIIFVDVVLNDYLINYTIFNCSIIKIRSPLGIYHYGIDVILLDCVQAKKILE